MINRVAPPAQNGLLLNGAPSHLRSPLSQKTWKMKETNG
jgi:hypothetical protein